jgi:hypothetical protein
MDDPNVEETTRVFVLIQFSSEYGKCTLGPGQPAQALCSDRRSMHGQTKRRLRAARSSFARTRGRQGRNRTHVQPDGQRCDLPRIPLSAV